MVKARRRRHDPCDLTDRRTADRQRTLGHPGRRGSSSGRGAEGIGLAGMGRTRRRPARAVVGAPRRRAGEQPRRARRADHRSERDADHGGHRVRRSRSGRIAPVLRGSGSHSSGRGTSAATRRHRRDCGPSGAGRSGRCDRAVELPASADDVQTGPRAGRRVHCGPQTSPRNHLGRTGTRSCGGAGRACPPVCSTW
jgi:hypothetical protein